MSELPPDGHCRRWLIFTDDRPGPDRYGRWCGAPDARLYPLGRRCDEHAPQDGVGQ